VPQSTIGRIESGVADPRVSTLDRLLRLCGDELDAVPRKGTGVDRSLLRANLERTWIERLEYGVAAARGMERFRRSRARDERRFRRPAAAARAPAP
jgi:transcriptional regulator with XRE-family HTH domain